MADVAGNGSGRLDRIERVLERLANDQATFARESHERMTRVEISLTESHERMTRVETGLEKVGRNLDRLENGRASCGA
jgi:phage shock protein A